MAAFPFQRPQHDSRTATGMLSPDFVVDERDNLIGQANRNLCTHFTDGTSLVCTRPKTVRAAGEDDPSG